MTVPQGYCWKVIIDPTRKGDDPGLFYGGHFRWSDIVTPGARKEDIPCPWPNGTVFKNVKTGEVAIVQWGRVIRRAEAMIR